MNKKELQKRCNELDIKYQDNDTNEQLELMIQGKESATKIEALEGEIAQKNSEISELKSNASTTDDVLQTLKAENTELSDSTAVLKAERDKLKSENEALEQSYSDLAQKNSEAQALGAKGDIPTVKIGKDLYRVVGKKFRINNKDISSKELIEDKNLCKELVKRGSGILRKVEPKNSES